MHVEASVENCNPGLEEEEGKDEEANGNKEQVRGKSIFKGIVSIISSVLHSKIYNGTLTTLSDKVRW